MRSWQSRSATFRALPTILICIALASVASAAHSQTAPVQYAAKYVCGVAGAAAGAAGAGIVAPGAYYTSINVHNPNAQAVEFEKLFDIALPSEKQGGRISQPVRASLKPQEAFEIECADIATHLDQNPKIFWKGFVTLRSSAELDVVAVYTAAASAGGSVVALHTERVPKRP
jgi:hypothetical protein